MLDIFSYNDTVGQLVREALVAESLCTFSWGILFGF